MLREPSRQEIILWNDNPRAGTARRRQGSFLVMATCELSANSPAAFLQLKNKSSEDWSAWCLSLLSTERIVVEPQAARRLVAQQAVEQFSQRLGQQKSSTETDDCDSA